MLSDAYDKATVHTQYAALGLVTTDLLTVPELHSCQLHAGLTESTC